MTDAYGQTDKTVTCIETDQMTNRQTERQIEKTDSHKKIYKGNPENENLICEIVLLFWLINK